MANNIEGTIICKLCYDFDDECLNELAVLSPFAHELEQ
jgi:hypothetical protein